MLHFAQNAFLWIAPFLVVLTLVVTIHELGHYWVARAFGVAIDKFSMGFGKAIVHWRSRSGTHWQIGWMPLGGYVKFAGDENAASVPDAEDLERLRREVLAREGPAALRSYFHFKPVWQRALIVAAGPFANFVLAVAIFASFALAAGEVTIVLPRVGDVEPGSPAAKAGFLPGDYIRKANGWGIDDFTDFRRTVMLRAGEPIRFTVDRGARTIELVATPERRGLKDPVSGAVIKTGYLGIGQSLAPQDLKTFRFTPATALQHGVKQTVDFIGTSLTYMRRMITGRESGDQLSGPIGIAGASKSVASGAISGGHGIGGVAFNLLIGLLGMAALVSVAVGFANLLPIPVLDGGHLLFYAYEAVARRPLTARVQEAGYRVGFALLIGLVVFATWNDLQRFRVFQLIGGLFS
jgi:regulator of sigma E protease